MYELSFERSNQNLFKKWMLELSHYDQVHFLTNFRLRAIRILIRDSYLRRNDTIESVHNHFFLQFLLVVFEPLDPKVNQRSFDD